MKSKKRKVVSITQSPMNNKRWCLELECGHDVWITSKSHPKRNTEKCTTCDREEEATGKMIDQLFKGE